MHVPANILLAFVAKPFVAKKKTENVEVSREFI